MTYTSALVQPQRKVRPSLGWVAIGTVLIVTSFVVAIVMVSVAFVNYINDMSDITVVEPGGRVTMLLDEIEYTVYSNDYSDPVVSVDGGPDGVHVLRSYDSRNLYFGDDYWYSEYYFNIDTAGAYVISNGGTTELAVGPNDYQQIARTSLTAFIIGTVLGLSGLILIIVILILRRGSRKRIRLATGTYSGVSYNPAQGPWGGNAPGWQNAPQPGSYGTLPPGSYGVPPPGSYGAPPPGQPGGQQFPPNGPPPSNWPGR